MADLTGSVEESLKAVTNRVIALKQLPDAIYQASPLAHEGLKNKLMRNGGKFISQPVHVVGGRLLKSYAPGQKFQDGIADPVREAQWDWKFLRAPLVYNAADFLKNGGSSAIANYVEALTQNLASDINDGLNELLLGDGTGNSSLDIDGIKNAVDDGTVGGYSTYGNLSRSTYTNWKGKVDSAPGAFTLANIGKQFLKTVDGNRAAKLGYTNGTLWEAMHQLMVDKQQYFGSDAKYDTIGFLNFKYRTARIVMDNNIDTSSHWLTGSTPKNPLFFLQPEHLHFVFHPRRSSFKVDKIRELDNQDAYGGDVKLMCNWICTNPRWQNVAYGWSGV